MSHFWEAFSELLENLSNELKGLNFQLLKYNMQYIYSTRLTAQKSLYLCVTVYTGWGIY